VFNQQKNTYTRIFFPNARAPSANQPYCFEAKEALRKKVIGQKVRV
jgi:endonuclease YncB( thermonuclease family)